MKIPSAPVLLYLHSIGFTEAFSKICSSLPVFFYGKNNERKSVLPRSPTSTSLDASSASSSIGSKRRHRRLKKKKKKNEHDSKGESINSTTPTWKERNKKMSKQDEWDIEGLLEENSKFLLEEEEEEEEKKPSSINCKHFGTCSGCTVDSNVQKIPSIRSSHYYFDSSFIQNHRTPSSSSTSPFYQVITPTPLTSWRTQAKLPTGLSSSSSSYSRTGCSFGLYLRHSHTLHPIIPDCRVHHPAINHALVLLEKATHRVGIVPYDEVRGEGELRYVQCQVERMTGKVCLTLVWNEDSWKGCQPGLGRLVKELRRLEKEEGGMIWHSIWLHLNDGLGNSIFMRGNQETRKRRSSRRRRGGGGEIYETVEDASNNMKVDSRWQKLHGLEFVREPIPGTSQDDEGMLYFTPSTFRQGNMDGFDAVAQYVAKMIPGGSAVCELYAGVGVLGLTALTYHHRLSRQHHQHHQGDDDGWWDDYDLDQWGPSHNYQSSNKRQAVLNKHQPLRWLRCSDENPSNVRCFNRAVDSMPVEVTGRHHRRSHPPSQQQQQQDSTMLEFDLDKTDQEEITLSELLSQIKPTTTNNDKITPTKKVHYQTCSATEALLQKGQALGADVLIVDPPRKGLDHEVIEQLCRPVEPDHDHVQDFMFVSSSSDNNPLNHVHTIIYVSCSFDSFTRDCDRLLASGGAGWNILEARGYVLFPGSDHVETVAVFQRDLDAHNKKRKRVK